MLHPHGHRPLPHADSKPSRSRAFWRSALLIILVAVMATTFTRGIAPARAAATAVTVTSSIVTGQQLSGTISWTASVNGGTASSVEFWIDGSNRWTEFYAPYQFNGDPDGRLATTTLTNGGHVLTVIARTSSGGSTSATANVTIANGTAPTPTPTPTSDAGGRHRHIEHRDRPAAVGHDQLDGERQRRDRIVGRVLDRRQQPVDRVLRAVSVQRRSRWSARDDDAVERRPRADGHRPDVEWWQHIGDGERHDRQRNRTGPPRRPPRRPRSPVRHRRQRPRRLRPRPPAARPASSHSSMRRRPVERSTCPPAHIESR